MIYVRGVKHRPVRIGCRSIGHARAVRAALIAERYAKVEVFSGLRAVKLTKRGTRRSIRLDSSGGVLYERGSPAQPASF